MSEEEIKKLMTPAKWKQVKVEKLDHGQKILETIKEQQYINEQETKNWDISGENLGASVIADRAKFLMEPPERTTLKNLANNITNILNDSSFKDVEIKEEKDK